MTGLTFLRIRGIPIQAHWSWLILFALIFQGVMVRFAAPEVETVTLLAMAAACAALFFVSLLLHELGHALWARRKGWQVDRITLYGLGGVAWVRPGPYYSARAALQVLAAGPLVTAVLVLLFAVAERTGEDLSWAEPVVQVLGYLTWINALLLAFNLAPAFPLDGGQLLRTWLAQRWGDAEAAGRTVARTGTVTGYLLLGGAVVLLVTGTLRAGYIAAILGAQILFLVPRLSRIWGGGAAEGGGASEPSRAVVVGDLVRQGPLVIPDGDSVAGFLDRIARSRGHSTYAFAVARDGAVVGYMSLALANQVPAEERDGAPVLDAMVRGDEAVQLDPNTSLEQAMEQLPGVEDRAIVVEEGRVTGVVSRQVIAETLLELEDSRRGRDPLAGVRW